MLGVTNETEATQMRISRRLICCACEQEEFVLMNQGVLASSSICVVFQPRPPEDAVLNRGRRLPVAAALRRLPPLVLLFGGQTLLIKWTRGPIRFCAENKLLMAPVARGGDWN